MTKRKRVGGIETPRADLEHVDYRVAANERRQQELRVQLQRLRAAWQSPDHTRAERSDILRVIFEVEQMLNQLRDAHDELMADLAMEAGGPVHRSGAGWEDELARAVERDRLSQQDAAKAKQLIEEAIAARDAALARATIKTKAGRVGRAKRSRPAVSRTAHKHCSSRLRTSQRPMSLLAPALTHAYSSPRSRPPSRRGWSEGGTYFR